ncbi:MAG: ACP S-malonyltransferase, partial [Candidatus Omnitrophica bacterium]|nr:ACP S-malonyltransferase [Candidatus Omnitrophota bacterium]
MSFFGYKRQKSYLFKAVVSLLILTFNISLLTPFKAYAQESLNLPTPGAMVLPSSVFTPILLKGVRINPDNPFGFKFIVDAGDSNLQGEGLKEASTKLIKYFLASLTIPEKDLWVNLSPYEKDRIIPKEFGITEMGKDLLAQDYLLKQLTASLMYPEKDLGKKFWDEVYQKAREAYGTTDIPVDSFNKVWIVPDKAVVYQEGNSAFVAESHLKVMLEEDYEALKSSAESRASARDLAASHNVGAGFPRPDDKGRGNRAPTAIIKEIILPSIEKEVNEGKNFVPLRQIFYSLILASWYKQALKESLFGKIYVDKKKISGVDVENKEVKQQIYNQYLAAFKKGVYNYIRQDYDPASQALVAHKYFSGGVSALGLVAPIDGKPPILKIFKRDRAMAAEVKKDLSPSVSNPLDRTYEVAVNLEGTNAETPNVSKKAALPSSGTQSLIGFFPGIGSGSAYRNLGSALYDTGIPEVQNIYREAAQVLGYMKDGKPDPTKLFFADENLPADPEKKLGFISIAFLVHNLALHEYFKKRSDLAGLPVEFKAYTGESFGILTAAIASKAVSLSDGIKIASFFIKCLADASRESVAENHHVIGIVGEDLEAVIPILEAQFKDKFEVHKMYSNQQVNVYVAVSAINEFKALMETDEMRRRFPDLRFKDLKPPTKNIAHSKKMSLARERFLKFIDENNIVFNTPPVPVISNNHSNMLTTADAVKKGILAMIDEPMDSQETVRLAQSMNVDLIVELGLGGKTRPLIENNYQGDTPFMEFTGESDIKTDNISSLQLIQTLGTELGQFKKAGSSAQIGEQQYNLLRTIFEKAAQNPFLQKLLLSFIRKIIKEDMRQEKKEDAPAFYKLLEILQNSYLCHFVLNIESLAPDALAISALFKKRLLSQEDKVDIDLLLLERSGREVQLSFMDYKYPETVTFAFQTLTLSLPELANKAKQLIRLQPKAKEIYEEIRKGLGLNNLDFFTNSQQVMTLGLEPYTIGMMVYQYVMFKLTNLYRPAILGQNFYFVSGADELGLMTAMAASGAMSIVDSIKLYQSLLRQHFNRDYTSLRNVAEQIHVAGNDIKMIDPRSGAVLKTRRDFINMIIEVCYELRGAQRKEVDLKFSSWVMSFDPAKINQVKWKKMNEESGVRMIHISGLDDLWKRNHNPDLDVLEDISTLRLTDQNRKVFKFAEGRGTTTANVYAYINPGETVVGFGKGGSESLTVFLLKKGEKTITVRKILSERLITAQWDREGTGVMIPPFKKAKQQAYYLLGLPEEVKDLFPRVYDIEERDIPTPEGGVAHEFLYDMSYVPGTEVSEFIREFSPSPDIVARLYELIFRNLKEIHSYRRRIPARPTLESSYFKKIEDRLALARKTAPNVFGDNLLEKDDIIINGKQYLNIRPLLEKLRSHQEYLDLLEPQVHSLVMGDTNTENIKITNVQPIIKAMMMRKADPNYKPDFTAEEIGLKFLDPRAIGFHENGIDTGADDPMYDNKPWHNSMGHYDLMHGEHFDLVVDNLPDGLHVRINFHENTLYTESYKGIEGYFKQVMTEAWGLDHADSEFLKTDPYWLIRFCFMMGTHFTAMPPFHFSTGLDGKLIDTYAHQRRPVAIYSEGIMWLNLALEMLEGKRTEFNGFEVPKLPYTPDKAMLTETVNSLQVPQQMQNNPRGPQDITKESRAFFSPWIRIVRGMALGGNAIGFNPQLAQNIRETTKLLQERIPSNNIFNRFSTRLTNLILDINDSQISLSANDIQKRVEILVGDIQEIKEPPLFVNASAILMDCLAQLKLPADLIVNDRVDVLQNALAKAEEIPYDHHGAYERLTSLTNLFLAAGQLGLKARLVGEKDHISASLALLKDISSHYYRGRGASALFSVLVVLGFEEHFINSKMD